MIKIDLQRIKEFSTREVFRQVADALNYLDEKKTGNATRTIVTNTSSGARQSFFNCVEYVIDQIDKDRGWVVVEHTPITNSETVFFNGIAILKGNVDKGIDAEYGIVGNIVTIDFLELGDVIKVTYAHY